MPTPRKLPNTDSQEGKLLAAMYVRSTEAEREDWAKQYGYANANNFTTGMKRQYGLAVPIKEPTVESEPAETVIHLPMPTLREYVALPHEQGQEETAVLHMSDLHLGKHTVSYDPDVAKNVCFMYTLNAKKAGWFDVVHLVVWGPSAKLLAEDRELQSEVKSMQAVGVITEACVVCARRYGVVDALKELGLA